MAQIPELHLVSFDVPFPADYGGVIDVFYKLKALHEAGVNVHLHCWQYGRPESPELEQLSASVTYYQRKTGPRSAWGSLPYIVKSRMSDELVENLFRNPIPILFEGLHTCGILADSRLAKQPKWVRMHNIEHDYYANLAKLELNLFRKAFFKQEAKRLKSFEPVLQKADRILAISQADANQLKARYGSVEVVYPFHPYSPEPNPYENKGYALYQGNLTVAENAEAVLWLLNEVWTPDAPELVIAGASPGKSIREASQALDNVRLVQNPDQTTMDRLIGEAGIHVLPGFRQAGVKLKLLAGMFSERPVITTPAMVEGLPPNHGCIVIETPEAFRQALTKSHAPSSVPEELAASYGLKVLGLI